MYLNLNHQKKSVKKYTWFVKDFNPDMMVIVLGLTILMHQFRMVLINIKSLWAN